MGRYFDYSEWNIDELCNHIRERIFESKKPIPKKVMKHYICIVFRTGENCYTYPNYGVFAYGYIPEFKTRKEAEDYLAKHDWIERKGDNCWVEYNEVRYYDLKSGGSEQYHYEIRESDYEEYEDGENYIEYTEEEKNQLSEILYQIERGKVCMSVYDHCCDQGSFGGGSFSEELKEELEKFEKEYTEELPEGWFDSDEDD